MFQLPISIDYLAMIIIGGLGSVLGSIYGAVFITLLPVVVRVFMETVGVFFVDGVYLAQVIAQMRLILFGGLIIAARLVQHPPIRFSAPDAVDPQVGQYAMQVRAQLVNSAPAIGKGREAT